MSSDRRTEANRLNAQKSTGPKTPEGKARSSRNALRHGLYADDYVMIKFGEKLEDWAQFLEAFRQDLKPNGAAQEAMVEQLAGIQWHIRRINHIEISMFDEAASGGYLGTPAKSWGMCIRRDHNDGGLIPNCWVHLNRFHATYLRVLKAYRQEQNEANARAAEQPSEPAEEQLEGQNCETNPTETCLCHDHQQQLYPTSPDVRPYVTPVVPNKPTAPDQDPTPAPVK